MPAVRWGRVRRAHLVLFRGQKNPHLKRALESLGGESLDPKQREFYVDPRFVFHFLRFLALTRSPQQAVTLAYLRIAKTRVICMMENYDKRLGTTPKLRWSDVLYRYLPGICVVKVQHGQDLQRRPMPANRKGVLAVWGQFSAEWFPKFGRVEQTYVITGALSDSRYRALVRNVRLRKHPGLCVVSTVKDEEWWGPPRTERRLGYEALMDFIARYRCGSQIPVAIALTVDRFVSGGVDQSELERQYFTDRFGTDIFFPDPSLRFGGLAVDEAEDELENNSKERYSSYALTDASTLSVGATGSTLWEAFGRGNRVLAVNLTDNPAFDFPVPGPWSMRQPSFEDFAARCSELISMPIEQYQALSAEARSYLMYYDSCDLPEERLRRYVEAVLQTGDPDKSNALLNHGRIR